MKQNVYRAICAGKIPFKVTKGEVIRYCFASSKEQCAKKFTGWKAEEVALAELQQNGYHNENNR